MEYTVCNISDSLQLKENAARILYSTFEKMGISGWSTYKSAIIEVEDCIQEPNIAIGLQTNGKLVGWIGIRPMYEKVWELHPLVVEVQSQKNGYGQRLIKEIEVVARKKGLIGLVLGTDDDNFRTSLSQNELTKQNIFSEIMSIKNINNHPFEFYEKCGYSIIGAIPNASGKNKPDIWMWKNLE